MSEPVPADAYADTVVSAIPETTAVRVAEPRRPAANRPAAGPPASRGLVSSGAASRGLASSGPASGALASRLAAPTVAALPVVRPPLVVPEPGEVRKAKKAKKAAPEHKHHLRLVGEHSRLRVAPEHRTRWLLSAAGALAVAIAFGLVYLHVIAAQRQLSLDRLNTEVTHQETSYQRLRLDVAELNAPSRIIQYAETTLGMSVPASVTVLVPTGPAPVVSNTNPTQAPSGNASWPRIKSLLAGTP